MGYELETADPRRDPANYMYIQKIFYKTGPDGQGMRDDDGMQISDIVILAKKILAPCLMFRTIITQEMTAEDFEASCKAYGYYTLLEEYRKRQELDSMTVCSGLVICFPNCKILIENNYCFSVKYITKTIHRNDNCNNSSFQ